MGYSAEKTLKYSLRLFVAGEEPNSVKAVANLIRLCEEYLKGRYELHIVDIFKDYQVAIAQQIIVVPTLIVESPPPRRTILGSLTDENKLLVELGLLPKGSGKDNE